MLKREKVIQLLIANGYDDTLATELPKLFIADYFEKSQELISEELDIFIDLVQRGDITPDENNNRVRFAYIKKVTANDFNQTKNWSVYYEFKDHITEEFINIVKRLPLRKILLNNVLELSNGYQRYNKEIVGSPQEYYDLCEIRSHTYNPKQTYIKSRDLLAILLSKGIKEEAIAVIYTNYDMDSIFSRKNFDSNIYIDYDAIMALGDKRMLHLLKTKNRIWYLSLK